MADSNSSEQVNPSIQKIKCPYCHYPRFSEENIVGRLKQKNLTSGTLKCTCGKAVVFKLTPDGHVIAKKPDGGGRSTAAASEDEMKGAETPEPEISDDAGSHDAVPHDEAEEKGVATEKESNAEMDSDDLEEADDDEEVAQTESGGGEGTGEAVLGDLLAVRKRLSENSEHVDNLIKLLKHKKGPLAVLKREVADLPTKLSEMVNGLLVTHGKSTSNRLQQNEQGIAATAALLKELKKQLGEFGDSLTGAMEEKIGEVQSAINGWANAISKRTSEDLATLHKKLTRQIEGVGDKVEKGVQDVSGTISGVSGAMAGVKTTLGDLHAHAALVNDTFAEEMKGQVDRLKDADEWWKKKLEVWSQQLEGVNTRFDERIVETQGNICQTTAEMRNAQEAGTQSLRDDFEKLQGQVGEFQGALDANNQLVEGFDQRQMSDEVLERLAQHTLELLTKPDNLKGLMDEYFASLSGQDDAEKKLQLIDRLPSAFDKLEGELNNWRIRCEKGEGGEHGEAIRDELLKVQQLTEGWQQQQGLVRFPNAGDPYDRRYHNTSRSELTDDATMDGRIKHVIRSGYRFMHNDRVIRTADVVVWRHSATGPSTTE